MEGVVAGQEDVRPEELFRVVRGGPFPPQRGLVLREGYAKWWMPEYASKRSQDIETIYHDAGQFYFFWQSTMREFHSVIGGQARPFVVPETEVQDIDNLSDWVIAEMKYERMVSHV